MLSTKDDELTPAAGDLLFFIDDTGHETFAGNQGYYGLGGCVVTGAGYPHLKRKWAEVRGTINGNPGAPLHASTMERRPKNFAALSGFFSDRSFLRIAVMTTKSITLPTDTHPCVPVMGQLREEIASVAAMLSCETVWIVVESSQRADPLVQTCFAQLVPLTTPWRFPSSIAFCRRARMNTASKSPTSLLAPPAAKFSAGCVAWLGTPRILTMSSADFPQRAVAIAKSRMSRLMLMGS